MKRLFLDTGDLLALELSDDQHHHAAQRHWQTLRNDVVHLITTSYVFDEVVTFFNRRGHYAKAVEVGTRLLSSPRVQLIHVDAVLFHAGWRYFHDHHDKRYSLTDCISFVVMEGYGIPEALAFDQHFEQAGFVRLPRTT